MVRKHRYLFYPPAEDFVSSCLNEKVNFPKISDDDEDGSAPMEADDDDDDGEGKGERKEKEIKEEKTEEGEKDKETPMEQQDEEDDVDPLDAYMEEVKQEVKKFNMGAMKGNDKVGVRGESGSASDQRSTLCMLLFSFFVRSLM